MTSVFVDTSALLTLLDRDDPRHEAARQALEGLEDSTLITHGYVVAESVAVARRRFGVDGAITLIDDLLPLIDVVPDSPAEHAAALSRYRSSLPSATSFVDQVSFEVIGRERVDTAFAFDPDFDVASVEVIPEPMSDRG